jgi:hypothetical protein
MMEVFIIVVAVVVVAYIVIKSLRKDKVVGSSSIGGVGSPKPPIKEL